MPFFSVVIPLYNKENYIKDTLLTVLNQTFKDFEVIIVNDGSTDNSVQIVDGFSDNRIILINQKNQGLSGARNTGIKNASADFITFIDADDFWTERHLEQLYDLIKLYPNMGIYASGYTLKKSDTISHRAQFNGLPNNFKGIVPNFFKHSLQSCIALTDSIAIPKRVFDDVGDYDTEIYSEQDTDLYIRIALKYEVALDDTMVTAIYNRTMEDNMSNFSQKKEIPKLLHAYKQEESKDPHLKRFLDYNRFSNYIYLKLSSNKKLAKELLHDIDFKNLTLVQRTLIKLPIGLLKILFNIKTKLKLNAAGVFKPRKTV
ncbi:glycosyltransferase family 2 protein [Hyunsoonleella sp. SJ7]|uniref:Glycosyltransferase family 2 protein n=1 Tax=Hyunsoonleella aquatilis TaxID=2762758 RepID=A0A923HAL0_9FLAO|nr:glycosyltransferase family 2 protein [Hyunsoonleella aquatilis]MBC3757451.1 glycosyltransferase family 2 protein [Hyunsoonleella aquatilis]